MKEIITTIEKLAGEGYSANYISDYFSFEGIVMEPSEVNRIIKEHNITRPEKRKVIRKDIRKNSGKGKSFRSTGDGNKVISRFSSKGKGF